eukprot:gene8795-14523_t
MAMRIGWCGAAGIAAAAPIGSRMRRSVAVGARGARRVAVGWRRYVRVRAWVVVRIEPARERVGARMRARRRR